MLVGGLAVLAALRGRKRPERPAVAS